MLEGDPDAVLATARRFRQVSDDIADIHGRFERGGLSGHWEGPAADAFRATVSDLPGELTKAADVNGRVADALSAFGYTLEGLQARSRTAEQSLSEAQSRAATAQSDSARTAGALRTAQRNYAAAAHDPHTEPAARRAVDASALAARQAGARLGTARADVDARGRVLDGIRDERDTAADVCARSIRDAFPSFKDQVTNWYADKVEGSFAGVVLDGIVDLVMSPVHLISALGKLIADPSWARFHEVLDELGTTLALVGLIAIAVISSPVTLGLTLAALTVAGIVVAGAKLGAGTIAYRKGELSSAELIGDGIGLGLAFLPLGKVAGKVAGAGSKSAATSYFRYGGHYRPQPRPRQFAEHLLGHERNHIIETEAELAYRWGVDKLHLPVDPPTRYLPPTPVLRQCRDVPPVLLRRGATVVHRPPLQLAGGGAW